MLVARQWSSSASCAGGFYKTHEERMRFSRTALEFGMPLACDEPWMIGDLDHFDQTFIR